MRTLAVVLLLTVFPLAASHATSTSAVNTKVTVDQLEQALSGVQGRSDAEMAQAFRVSN